MGDLTVEPGATLEWEAGTIEIERGTWRHPEDLTVGCTGRAVLRLVDGATIEAPHVHVCARGAVIGEGSFGGTLSNGGLVVPVRRGARCRTRLRAGWWRCPEVEVADDVRRRADPAVSPRYRSGLA